MKKLFTKENAKAMGRKGGKAKTQAKKTTARLNALAKRKRPLAQLMRLAGTTDPTETLKFVLKYVKQQEEIIERTKKDTSKFYMIDRMNDKMLQLHKLKFGEKHQNLNVNVDIKTMQQRVLDNEEIIFERPSKLSSSRSKSGSSRKTNRSTR